LPLWPACELIEGRRMIDQKSASDLAIGDIVLVDTPDRCRARIHSIEPGDMCALLDGYVPQRSASQPCLVIKVDLAKPMVHPDTDITIYGTKLHVDPGAMIRMASAKGKRK